jgi:endonuclease III
VRAPATRKPTPAKSRGKAIAKPPARAAPKAPAERGTDQKPAKLMTLGQVRGFLEALRRAMPNPRSELEHSDPFTLLVAVVLSAQATDAGVNRATRGLFAAAPDAARMAALGEAGIAAHIRTIGLWQAKAKAVAGLSQVLVGQHGGKVPHDREALEALPGVGRKTANVVLNVAFGEPTIAVDTHIFRLGNRTGIAPGKTPRAVEDGLLARVPKELLHNAHHWLILHGRYVCKARRPECWRCVAAEWCNYPDKTPAPQEKPPAANV